MTVSQPVSDTNVFIRLEPMKKEELEDLIKKAVHDELAHILSSRNPELLLEEYKEFLTEAIREQQARKRLKEKIVNSAVGALTVLIVGAIVSGFAWVGKLVIAHIITKGGV